MLINSVGRIEEAPSSYELILKTQFNQAIRSIQEAVADHRLGYTEDGELDAPKYAVSFDEKVIPKIWANKKRLTYLENLMPGHSVEERDVAIKAICFNLSEHGILETSSRRPKREVDSEADQELFKKDQLSAMRIIGEKLLSMIGTYPENTFSFSNNLGVEPKIQPDYWAINRNVVFARFTNTEEINEASANRAAENNQSLNTMTIYTNKIAELSPGHKIYGPIEINLVNSLLIGYGGVPKTIDQLISDMYGQIKDNIDYLKIYYEPKIHSLLKQYQTRGLITYDSNNRSGITLNLLTIKDKRSINETINVREIANTSTEYYQEDEKIYTTEDISKLYKLSGRTIHDLIQRKELVSSLRIDKKKVYTKQDIERALAYHTARLKAI